MRHSCETLDGEMIELTLEYAGYFHSLQAVSLFYVSLFFIATGTFEARIVFTACVMILFLKQYLILISMRSPVSRWAGD